MNLRKGSIIKSKNLNSKLNFLGLWWYYAIRASIDLIRLTKHTKYNLSQVNRLKLEKLKWYY